MRVFFMGTPDFACESLRAIHNAGHEIIGVITNPDRPSGRGMKLNMSPVKIYSLEQGFTVYQPEKIKNNIDIIETIKKLNPDVICVVAYGKILPKEILELPKLGCINVHGSILPKYRGAAPIQWAVLNGDKTTGVTTIYMDEGMDTGDIILTKETEIGENETTGELWDRLSKMGGEILAETLEQIKKNTAQRKKQSQNFSMAPMIKKEIGLINFNEQSAEKIKNLVRGLSPFLGAYTFYEGKKIKFWKVEILNKEEKNQKFGKTNEIIPGRILLSDSKDGLYIQTIDDKVIKVLEIQSENAKRMGIQEFLRGKQLKEKIG